MRDILSIWRFCKGYRWRLVAILYLVLLEAATTSISISMVLPILESISGGNAGASSFLSYVPEVLRNNAEALLIAFAGVLLLKVALTLGRNWLTIQTTEEIKKKTQVSLSERYIYLPYANFSQHRQGVLLNNLIRETNLSTQFIFNYISFLADVIILCAILITLFLVSWAWSLAAAVAIAILWATAGRAYFRWSKALGSRAVVLNQHLMSELDESLQGFKELKIFGTEAFRLNQIRDVVESLRRNRIAQKIAAVIPSVAIEGLFALTVLVFALVLLAHPVTLEDAIPLLGFFAVGVSRVLALAGNVVSKRFKALAKLPSFEVVEQALNEQAVSETGTQDGAPIRTLDTDIDFEEVCFRYPADESPPVLQSLTMRVMRGGVTCLIGASGSGKTTIVDLLARLFEPNSGRIRANGRAISEYALRDWRSLIGYVSQEPVLFHGSIRDNITMGDTSVSPAQLDRAASLAMVDEFLQDRSEGFDLPVGDKGSKLSGGQKRRIALARALCRNCPIIVIDEATSAVPEPMETEIIQGLRKSGDLTIIVISHRSNTSALSDVCYRMNDGRVELWEEGTGSNIVPNDPSAALSS